MTLNNTNAKLTLRSIQEIMGEEQVSLTNEDAFFSKRGNKYYVIYKEHDENGHSENTVRVIVTDKSMIVSRSGMINARLVYEKDVKTDTNYRLPYGVLNVEVYTRSLDFKETLNGFNLIVDYDVSMGEEKLKTCLEITVEKRSND